MTLTAADFTSAVANLPGSKRPWWLLPGVGLAALVVIREWLWSRVVLKPAATAARPVGGDERKLLAWVVVFVAFSSIWHFLSMDEAPRHRAHKARNVRAE